MTLNIGSVVRLHIFRKSGFRHAALALPLAACTSFSTVRSAEVRPGVGAMATASLSGRVGAETGWFYSFDCADACDRQVPGLDAAVTYGWLRALGARPATLALGTSGPHPYVDGYLQLGAGAVPFGVGARVGLPVTGWAEHQLYGRADLRLGAATRLLLNPALFVHHGHSPNGENRGSFVAFAQGVGLEIDAGRVAFTPAVALVAGRSERTTYGQRIGPAAVVFPTASLGVRVHRAPRR